jgi:hypothetical protein
VSAAEHLAAARTAAAEILRQDTGEDHPRWRVVITDSESPTGIAPVCAAPGDAHTIADYPGGPIRDEDGVYDCCPEPHIDTYCEPIAVYLVALLNADAPTATTPAGGAR